MNQLQTYIQTYILEMALSGILNPNDGICTVNDGTVESKGMLHAVHIQSWPHVETQAR